MASSPDLPDPAALPRPCGQPPTGVGISHAGLLITAFAIGMIVGSSAMAMATPRLPQRKTLILALTASAPVTLSLL
ncbi:hypothetical protein OHB00_02510 [Streptomyces sp. NBC_00631]|uniref:hypothetical protein n=1 Tax=Streptomyces sp. NBC_00631 TaxID=2975793 RepID=UPI0030DF8075